MIDAVLNNHRMNNYNFMLPMLRVIWNTMLIAKAQGKAVTWTLVD